MHKCIIEKLLRVTIKSFQTAGGGCIGDSYAAEDTNGIKYFVKSYRKTGIVAAELVGLSELTKTGVIKVPTVIASSETVLVLEYIESSTPNRSFYENFGHELAEMHKTVNSSFGFTQNTYLGTYLQDNRRLASWSEFYIEQRLAPQFELALKKGTLKSKKVDSFLREAVSYISDGNIKPSLIHGDLWSGNFMVGSNGEPVIFDPAVSYSHWELELAMTKLFGGFKESFYHAYHEVNRKTEGYAIREDIYTLYHLLNHLNLFGTSYLSQVSHIIDKYI